MHTSLNVGILCGGLTIAMGSSSMASTIRVPKDAATVLAAVDQAQAGDSVLVSPGTWTDKETRIINLDGFPTAFTACAFPRGGISILSEGGANVTTMDIGEATQGRATVIMIANQIGIGDILVDGFTLTGARGSIAAHALVAVKADMVTLRSCQISENGSSPTEGNAIQGSAVKLEMISCDIANNIGDIAVFAVDSPARFEGCRFTNNIGHCIQAHQELTGASFSVENCEFAGNRWRGRGTCVDVLYSHNIIVRRNVFLRNVATEFSGAGMRVSDCSGVIEFNVFAYDSSLSAGTSAGGMVLINTTAGVTNNSFIGCHGNLPGSAFIANDGSSIAFDKNVLAHSTGSAAVQDYGNYVYTSSCNLFWSNDGGDFGSWSPSETDIFADPLFCGLDNLDFTVREDSPCIIGGCGQIGALGIGCEDVSVDEMSWGKIKGLYRIGGKAQ